MKKSTKQISQSKLALAAGMLTAFPILAAPLNFTTAPAGASAREPAPNIIVSVDDSGSMGASGMATLKAALTQTFSVSNVADGRVRLAWHSMNTCMALSTNGATPANCGAFNGIAPLEGNHRTNFLNWVNINLPALPPNSNLTPSHQMLQRSGEYLRTTGQYSPYRSTPGSTTDSTELSCRKSFNIFMTDGAWNTFQASPYLDGNGISVGGGNADGISKTFPDGVQYVPETAQTRLYSDPWGSTTVSTLSDVAFHYWSTDLQPTLSNNVRPSVNWTGTETVGANTLQQYWNPRNNPATWQHMTTYSIGFNPLATTWLGSPTYTIASGMYGGPGYIGIANTHEWVSPLCSAVAGNPDTIGGNLDCNVNTKWNARGNYRSSELWHMALNSRGKFVPAPDAQSLVTAFRTILDDILAQTSRPLVAVTASSSRLTAGNFAYVAGYDSQSNWSGSLAAFAINPTTSRPATTATWRAEQWLNTPTFSVANRVVLTHNGTQGRSFKWENLSTNQQLAIQGADSTATGTARISYLRGDRSLEGAAGSMRTRSSRLGDIVNSNIWYTGKPTRTAFELPGHASFRTTQAGRTPTVYVGANDGMLHGFDANTGKELLAYVPAGLYGTTTNSPLRDLTRTNYSHRYYVDGHPFTSDVNIGGSGATDWRTVLVGSLGAGGKGYFILDVTNPSNFVDPGTGVSNVVLKDETATADADIGHIFGAAVVDDLTASRSEQIVRLNDSSVTAGRWAVVMGNGYNSTNERPVLLIQYLDGAKELRKIPVTSATGDNGLGVPRPVDLNGDGKIDLVYAGDLKGNLWKFDLTSNTPANWTLAFSGSPLFIAKDSAGTPQPITSAPYWRTGPSNLGGVQVLFGTGRNVTTTDPGDTQVQSIYSVWDMSQYSWVGSNPVNGTDGSVITGARSTALVPQTQTSASANGRFFGTSSNAVTYSRVLASAKRGWFFDLPVSRERVLTHPFAFEGDQILINSLVPTSSASGETCDLTTATGSGYLNVFNIYSGAPPKNNVFGTGNGNRVQFGTGDLALQRDVQNNKWDLFTPEATCPPGDPTCGGCTPGVDCPCVPGVDCPTTCGGLSGPFLQMCKAGLGGARFDWREVR